MLCCETGGSEPRDIEDLAAFVVQLHALEVPVRVHVHSVPRGLARTLQFDLAPFLVDRRLEPEDRVVLLAAHRLADATLVRLRRLAVAAGVPCLGFGGFESRQAMIGATAKLSYVFGEDPRLYDLATAPGGALGLSRDAPVFGVARRETCPPVPRVLLVAPDLRDGNQAAALNSLALSRKFRIAVLTDGRSKQEWSRARGAGIPVYQYGEIVPAGLARRVEICASFAPLQNNYRLQCLIANLAASGAALVDCTPEHAIARDADAFVRGPVDLATLAGFLNDEVLPNLEYLGEHVRGSRTATAWSAEPVLRFLGTASGSAPVSAARRAPGPARVVFMPTNGVGLGHAQRCALIASELERTRVEPVFAAFPSCTRLIKSQGFDVMPLVQRSALHAQSHENDLVNYLRLRALVAPARTLVFDGGYVFDSVYRSVLERELRGIWIRRGLWQPDQDNSIGLDREKAFDRVIVPREAFEELNADYSRGEQVRHVAPIVQRIELGADDRGDLRRRLAARFDRDFERLVVSLLGAGVAADRSAQVQALCGIMERRADALHLVVAWPTSVLQPGWFGWRNSRVVKTQRAGVLAVAADLCISAAGYNSFHEMLYNRVPTIFVPQTSGFLDDQRARARAARERGLAGCVDAEALLTLDREIARFLDGGEDDAVRARLAALDLPAPGNADAARLIEEASHGPSALERQPVAHRRARRR